MGTELLVTSIATVYDALELTRRSSQAFAMIIWLLVAPVAVLVGRLGRAWQKWYTVHSSLQVSVRSESAAVRETALIRFSPALAFLLQAFISLPATVVIVALGIAAAAQSSGSGGLSAHAVSAGPSHPLWLTLTIVTCPLIRS